MRKHNVRKHQCNRVELIIHTLRLIQIVCLMAEAAFNPLMLLLLFWLLFVEEGSNKSKTI